MSAVRKRSKHRASEVAMKDWGAPEEPDRAVWIEAWFIGAMMLAGALIALFG